jgi:hypothetical protein
MAFRSRFPVTAACMAVDILCDFVVAELVVACFILYRSGVAPAASLAVGEEATATVQAMMYARIDRVQVSANVCLKQGI